MQVSRLHFCPQENLMNTEVGASPELAWYEITAQ